MDDQKIILVRGEKNCLFHSTALHQGTLNGMKLNAEQGFAAQNPSRQNKMRAQTQMKKLPE